MKRLRRAQQWQPEKPKDTFYSTFFGMLERMAPIDVVPAKVRSKCCRAPVVRVVGHKPWKCGGCGRQCTASCLILLGSGERDKYTNAIDLMRR